jgi:ABC-2 type transport system permease protein
VTVTTNDSGVSIEAGRAGGLRGAWTVYRFELVKLTGQVRTRISVALCVLAPFAFVAAMGMQDATPDDTLFGRWLHASGFATPLVVLAFGSQWAFPALTSVVAGDMFSSEDHFGTWGMILTRSRTRAEIFAGKTLAAMTYAIVVIVLLAGSSMAAGVLLVGHQPLINLSGVLAEAGDWTWLVPVSWAVVLPPVLVFTALGLLMSVATRNGPAGIAGPVVIGLLLQLGAMVDTPAWVRALLPTTSFEAWHGLLTTPRYTGPLTWNLVVSAGYTVVFLGVAYRLLRRRDMRGN